MYRYIIISYTTHVQTYIKRLILTIDKDIFVAIRRIVDSFVSMFKPRMLNPIYKEKQRFVYHGFDSQT